MSIKYITPRKLRAHPTGLDLSAYSDAQLDAMIVSASSRINTMTAAPNYPQPHDFRGGTITGERHRWYLGTEVMPASRRYYPYHRPFREVTGFRIHVTEGHYIVIDPDDMFAHGSGFVEVVALTMGVGIYPVVSNLSITTPVAEMDYTYGRVIPVTGEVLSTQDGRVFEAVNQWWHPDPTIYLNDVATTSGQVDLDEGTVTFTEVLDDSDVVSADYEHKLPYAFVEATAMLATQSVGRARVSALPLLVAGGRIRVAEVEIERRATGAVSAGAVSEWQMAAAELLQPYVFHNVAGY